LNERFEEREVELEEEVYTEECGWDGTLPVYTISRCHVEVI
jgi:hypothetical protein